MLDEGRGSKNHDVPYTGLPEGGAVPVPNQKTKGDRERKGVGSPYIERRERIFLPFLQSASRWYIEKKMGGPGKRIGSQKTAQKE